MEEVIKKKRGRKPKILNNIKILPDNTILKKRGRKPKIH